MDYLIVAVLQILYSILKVFEIKWNDPDNLIKLTIITTLGSLITIISIIFVVIDYDLWMIATFVLSNAVGKIIALTVFHVNPINEQGTKLNE